MRLYNNLSLYKVYLYSTIFILFNNEFREERMAWRRALIVTRMRSGDSTRRRARENFENYS